MTIARNALGAFVIGQKKRAVAAGGGVKGAETAKKWPVGFRKGKCAAIDAQIDRGVQKGVDRRYTRVRARREHHHFRDTSVSGARRRVSRTASEWRESSHRGKKEIGNMGNRSCLFDQSSNNTIAGDRELSL